MEFLNNGLFKIPHFEEDEKSSVAVRVELADCTGFADMSQHQEHMSQQLSGRTSSAMPRLDSHT
jgi:hypothetical protein